MSQKNKDTLRAAMAGAMSSNCVHLLSKVYTAEEAAAIAACDTDTLAAHTVAGTVPGIKWGRSWVYPALAFHLSLSLAALDAPQQRTKNRGTKPVDTTRPAANDPAPTAKTQRASWRRTPPPLPNIEAA